MTVATTTEHSEPHSGSVASRLNWLRAGVLGANDGIISMAGLVIGIAAATTDAGEIATAGVAGLVAGAVSMALGEYVSVSSQRDTERALIEKEQRELADSPVEEQTELVSLLIGRGLSARTAEVVAGELTRSDPLGTHLAVELGINEQEIARPWVAAASSAVAFSVGAAVPVAAILTTPPSLRIVATFLAVVLGLLVTGWLSASLGGAPKGRATLRLIVGGAAAMAVTFGVGYLFGASIG